MADLPPSMAVIPADLSLYSVRFDVVDSAGRILPKPFLHHFNLTIPSRRDLFLPIAQRFLAASKETPAIELPSLVIGMPLERDAQLLVTGMISNATPTAQRGLRIRATLGTRRAGFFPFFRAYPFVMDAHSRTSATLRARCPLTYLGAILVLVGESPRHPGHNSGSRRPHP